MGKSLVIGVDIGHHSIKAVALKPSKGTFTLVSYQELPIEADIFTDNHMLNYQKIVKKLKELRKSLPLFSRKVALAIPDNAVISKVLQIDSALDAQEREYAIFQAFAHQSPFPIEELNLDFVEVNRASASQALASYQVYATKRDVAESRVSGRDKSWLSTRITRCANAQPGSHLANGIKNAAQVRLVAGGRWLEPNLGVYGLAR